MRRRLYPGVIFVLSKGLLCEAVDEERQYQPVDCDYADNDANHQLNYYRAIALNKMVKSDRDGT